MSEKKVVVHINPPPKDGSCEICKKKWEELPIIKKGDFRHDDFIGMRLIKTFRNYFGWSSASWECIDCLGEPVEWETPGANVDDFQ